jgi:hypothetical protein
MADRTSAAIFADIFTEISRSKISAPEAWELAEKVWDLSLAYDFSPQQMGIEEVLETLGLAGHDEEGYWIYGPDGDRQ